MDKTDEIEKPISKEELIAALTVLLEKPEELIAAAQVEAVLSPFRNSPKFQPILSSSAMAKLADLAQKYKNQQKS